MTIGELLKQKRLENGKTQKDWVGNIISTSYYAKVEKNQHRIAAEDLIAILKHNDLSISNFFETLADQKSLITDQKYKINRKAIDAVYKNDIEQLNTLIEQIKMYDHWSQDEKEESILLIQGFIESVKNDLDKTYVPNQTIAQNIKEKIFNIPDFNRFKLELYVNFMFMYDYQTNIVLTKQVIKQIDNSNDDKEFLAISGILNNLIFQLIENKQFALTLPFFEAATKLPNLPDLYLSKCLICLSHYVVNYHLSHKQEDLDKAEMIAKNLTITGFKEFGENAQKFINEEIKE